MMSLVSVIIPSYNHARFVAQAVESALAQTHPQTEVIVVDDGSTDDTRAVLSDYTKRQVRYIYQENRGPSAARNTGVTAAQGEYLLFLDADDLIPPRKLALHMALLEAHPEFGLVYSGFQYLSEDGTKILGEERPNQQGQVLKDLLRRTLFFPPGAAVLSRACVDRVGLFDESLSAAADTDMWVRIAAGGYAFGCIEQPLFLYRIAQNSMSSEIQKQARDEFARLDKFFSCPYLPEDVRELKGEAYGVMHYECRSKYYHAGDVTSAQAHLRQAIALCPTLSADREWLLEWIAGYALGPRVSDPAQFMDTLFENLPPEAVTLKELRRRAIGRYHVAAAFRADRSRRYDAVRAHVLPALVRDPSILRNRRVVPHREQQHPWQTAGNHCHALHARCAPRAEQRKRSVVYPKVLLIPRPNATHFITRRLAKLTRGPECKIMVYNDVPFHRLHLPSVDRSAWGCLKRFGGAVSVDKGAGEVRSAPHCE